MMRFSWPQRTSHGFSKIWGGTLLVIGIKYWGHRRVIQLQSQLILDFLRICKLRARFDILIAVVRFEYLHEPVIQVSFFNGILLFILRIYTGILQLFDSGSLHRGKELLRQFLIARDVFVDQVILPEMWLN
jgi:hypothetical protein